MNTTSERVRIPGMPLYPTSTEHQGEFWGSQTVSTLYRLYRALRALADVACFTPARPFWLEQVEYDVACLDQSVRNLCEALNEMGRER